MAQLAVDEHVKYIVTVGKRTDSFESVVLEHIRMNGAYWGLSTLYLLGKLDAVDSDEIIEWVMKCQHESGGFAGNIGHDPHILNTLSAVQVLALLDKLNVLDVDRVSNYVAGLQNQDGSFSGDIDSSELHRELQKCGWWIWMHFWCRVSCWTNFLLCGCPGTYGSLRHVDKDLLGWWLCERQVKSGGLNGRPEKLPDVCYSWFVLCSLIMINRVHWISKEKLVKYILNCQDTQNGGISDRPDDAVDVFHTHFGVAGLSLLEYPGLKAIDPAYALPVDVVNIIVFGR